MDISNEIHDFQVTIEEKDAEIKALKEELEAPCDDCGTYASEVADLKTRISELEEAIQEGISNCDNAKNEIETAEYTIRRAL